ncbi:MAG TPA: GDP-mannose mannosyl hydrolase [Campylobacterales bacterium]|nr:GDP-mannose mannosyl hydrolase [Campylobacterales bacterium]
MYLNSHLFSSIIEHTPLISIDLIIKNLKGEILLGKRVNAPAKGAWFVPGGRIYKDEKLQDAFLRITQEELGVQFSLSSSDFLGVYEHMYEENVFNNDFSTHYVVLGFELELEKELKLNTLQHDNYQWLTIDALFEHQDVHDNVKDYFKKNKGINQ